MTASFVGVEIACSPFLRIMHQAPLSKDKLWIRQATVHHQSHVPCADCAAGKKYLNRLPTAVVAGAWHTYLSLLSTCITCQKHICHFIAEVLHSLLAGCVKKAQCKDPPACWIPKHHAVAVRQVCFWSATQKQRSLSRCGRTFVINTAQDSCS